MGNFVRTTWHLVILLLYWVMRPLVTFVLWHLWIFRSRRLLFWLEFDMWHRDDKAKQTMEDYLANLASAMWNAEDRAEAVRLSNRRDYVFKLARSLNVIS